MWTASCSTAAPVRTSKVTRGEALALAANDLARRGKAIEAGWVVLTGGITDAVFAPPGSTVEVKFSSLGEVTIDGGVDPGKGDS